MHKAAKSKKDVVSEFRHSQIVSSARAVFAKKGYQATTMDEIASAAGLAKGTLYLFWKRKGVREPALTILANIMCVIARATWCPSQRW
ncbi:MAG: helix-turn-helix domain-containing protein [Candidatus Angelobacter sp.]